ncbi:MAG TPA: alpha/beta fold hydrolase [Cellulomonas sp.]
MPLTTVDDVRICFETVGPADADPLVLIGGSATQLIDWRDGLCDLLVTEGFRVIRFDHRDTGRSQRFGGRRDVDGGYSVQEMSLDVLRVLDTLDLPAAHLVGHSMGGIMAQYLALDHPDRVRSLALIGTIPGRDPSYLLGPTPTADQLHPVRRLPRFLAVRQFVATQRAMHADAFDFDEADERAHARRQLDRGYVPNGFWRHWSALLRADDRLDRLPTVRVPTVVLHGREDATLHPRAAELLADAVPGAELHVIDQMGHRLERDLWPVYVHLVARNARRAGHPDRTAGGTRA